MPILAKNIKLQLEIKFSNYNLLKKEAAIDCRTMETFSKKFFFFSSKETVSIIEDVENRQAYKIISKLNANHMDNVIKAIARKHFSI